MDKMSFEGLDVWPKAHELTLLIHREIVPKLPLRDLGHISPKFYYQARELADTTYRLLNGYIAYLKRRKLGANEPRANIQERRVNREVVNW